MFSVKLLLGAGAEVRAPDAMGSTAFHLFCGEGHLTIVQDLLRVRTAVYGFHRMSMSWQYNFVGVLD